jgi:hypothetical protein
LQSRVVAFQALTPLRRDKFLLLRCNFNKDATIVRRSAILQRANRGGRRDNPQNFRIIHNTAALDIGLYPRTRGRDVTDTAQFRQAAQL